MSSSNNLINDYEERISRQKQKEDLILRFLRQHIWSTQKILQQLLSLVSRQATHKTLIKLESKGLLKRHIYRTLGGNLTVWGITNQGQALAFNVQNESMVLVYFEPNRVSEQTIRHQLDIQSLRLNAEASGWYDWVDGDRSGASDKDKKRPDAVVRNISGNLVAVECERSFKSVKRYESILVAYLKMIKAQEIKCVVWVCPNKNISSRLKSIITNIKFVRINGHRVIIEPEKHHKYIHFCSYEEWPNYE